MASAARCSPKAIDRATSSAVCGSIDPSRAERWAPASSSVPVRASCGSSCGVNPSNRSTASAEALSAATSHPKTAMNHFCGSTTSRATRIGAAIAQFFGTSSPKTICTKVTSTKAAVTATPRAAVSSMPATPSAPVTSSPTEGPVR